MSSFRGLNSKNKIKKAYDSVAGPNPYATATKPTITFRNLKTINALEDVRIIAEGYIAIPTAVNGNVVTFKVMTAPAHNHTFTTSGALATHQHDITTAVAGGVAMTEPLVAGALESFGGGITMANAVDAKTGGTPAGTNAANAVAIDAEITDGANLSGVTFRGEAIGW